MKRVLFVNPTADLGGGPAIANLLASHVRGYFEVTEFFPTQGPAAERAQKLGITSFFSSGKGMLRAASSLKKIISSENIDIVHAHGTRAALWVKLAFFVGAKRKPFIYTLHGIHFLRKNVLYRTIFLIFERITNRMVSALVTVSDTDHASAEKYELINQKRLFLIHNGIDYESFSGRDGGKLRAEWNASEKFLILTVCRLAFPKDVATIIRAVHELPAGSFKLVIVGSGPDEGDLKDIDAKLGGGSVFLGDRDDIPNILAAADVFVLSSKWEGLPVTILEAIAAARPVVASNSPGIRDIIKDNGNGLLFSHGDAQDLKSKLELLSRDSGLRKKLAEAGSGAGRESFSAVKMADAYMEIYKKYS